MKKLMISAALFLFATSAFCQEVQNGVIYVKHPYIDVVNKAVNSYTSGDFSTLKSMYADTASFWSPGMKKWVSFDSTVNGWKNDMNYFTDLKMTPVGYPDYLHYKKDDAKIVQSWWTWSAKSKKTGEEIKVPIALYDEFNNAGKIIRQYYFGDFSKVAQEEM